MSPSPRGQAVNRRATPQLARFDAAPDTTADGRGVPQSYAGAACVNILTVIGIKSGAASRTPAIVDES